MIFTKRIIHAHTILGSPLLSQTPSRGVPLPDESTLRKHISESNGGVGTVGEYAPFVHHGKAASLQRKKKKKTANRPECSGKHYP